MPLAELEKLPEYQKLTPKQQLFIATYTEGGLVDGNYDAVAAVMTAYQCKSIEVARVMSYTMLANIRIIEVLNRHFGREPKEQFLLDLDRAIRNNRLTNAQLQALRLKCDILGYANHLPTENAATDRIPKDVQRAERPPKPKKPKKPKVEKAPKLSEMSDYEKEAARF
jgi:hypothetical protein